MAAELKRKNTKVGQILKSKKGIDYIKFSKNASFKEGDSLFMEDPRVTIARLAQNGHINDEEAELRLSKLPDFVLFDLVQVSEG